MGEWKYSSSILDLGQLRATAAPVPNGYEVVWLPYPPWTLWTRETSVVLAGQRTPATQTVARCCTD
jgi:hypothetical protein